MLPENFHSYVADRLRQTMANTDLDEAAQLNSALRLLSKWRSALIQSALNQAHGTQVMSGPLVGLDFLSDSAEGCHIPKILGCYEQPLQPYIAQAMRMPYSVLLNIGCAEGYYAVGMARQMPQTQVYAFDLNPKAREVCTELAVKNAVQDRVTVAGLFQPEDFASYVQRGRVLVVCDIEGAEGELLRPDVAPALKGMDLIVEAHEGFSTGMTQTLIERFAPTHQITLVQDNGLRQLPNPPAWFFGLPHLDQVLATWEWRSSPTPWLVMGALAPSA